MASATEVNRAEREQREDEDPAPHAPSPTGSPTSPISSSAHPTPPEHPSTVVASSVPHSHASPYQVLYSPHLPHQPLHFFPADPQMYSPSTGLSPTTLYATSQPDRDGVYRDLRAMWSACMDRVTVLEARLLQRDELAASLTAQVAQQDDLITSLTARVSQQEILIHSLQTRDTNRDIQVRTQSEEIHALQTRIADPAPAPVDPALEARLTTIQTEVQKHSEWVDVVRKAPPPHSTVSETLAETRRRSDRALNIRIRGIERADAAAPMQQAVDFVTQTMGLQDHGVTAAYRAGRDVTRPQPLIIRFRDAQARLAVLRRRGRLRDHPQIHMDEDLTPMQWQEHRSLLAQRQAARAEGKWAFIRDGRLVTGTMRQTGPAPTTDRPGPS